MAIKGQDKSKIRMRLKAARKERGHSQLDLARILGISNQAVSKWERCEAFPQALCREAIERYIAGRLTPQEQERMKLLS